MEPVNQYEGVFTLIAQKQNAMNSMVNPDWTNAGYPFFRAVWTEAAEALGHLTWEWWKKGTPPNEEQRVQLWLELADILHFGVSMLLLHDAHAQRPEDAHEIPAGVSREAFESTVGRLCQDALLCEVTAITDRPMDKVYATIASLESVVVDAIREGNFNSFSLFLAAHHSGLNVAGLCSYYLGKNVLNRFRQSHGYKTGSYFKNWNTVAGSTDVVEDNVFLGRCISIAQLAAPNEKLTESQANGTFEELVYSCLETEYAKVVAFHAAQGGIE